MIKKIFFFLVLGLIAYSLVLTTTPYYHYYAFKSDLEETLRVSVTDRPEELMTRILNLAETYNVPIEKEDIHLKATKVYTVTVSWKETVVFFPGYPVYQKSFKFYIKTSG